MTPKKVGWTYTLPILVIPSKKKLKKIDFFLKVAKNLWFVSIILELQFKNIIIDGTVVKMNFLNLLRYFKSCLINQNVWCVY